MSRRAVAAGCLAGLLALVFLDALAARAGIAAGMLPRGSGPWPWVASRAAGLAAFVALTLDVLFGLFLSTGAADRWIARARSVEIHKWLGSAALTLVVAHALFLAADRLVRFDVLDAVVPFLAPYRPVAVGIGVLAAYASIVVIGSFSLRARIGARMWRRLHALSFVAFALALAHGVFAGSDVRSPAFLAIYAVACVLVGALTVHRVWRARRSAKISARASGASQIAS
jgi:sulfoxide reductase heme-binding subunit YedZ